MSLLVKQPCGWDRIKRMAAYRLAGASGYLNGGSKVKYHIIELKLRSYWQRDRSMANEKCAQQAVQEFVNLLAASLSKTYSDYAESQSGMHNCNIWMRRVLENAQIEYQHADARGKRAELLVFELHEVTLRLTHQHFRADMHNLVLDVPKYRSSSAYVGTLLQVTLRKSTVPNAFRFQARWFAQSPELVNGLSSPVNFKANGWDFPQPLWYGLDGNAKAFRDWITLAKLSL